MRLRLLCLLALVLGAARTSHADFVLTIQNGTIPEGGTGTIDVLIESDDPSGDPLAIYNIQLTVSAIAPTTSALQFVDPQSTAYRTTDTSYVFHGDTADIPVTVDSTGIFGPNYQTLTGGDLTGSFGDVNVTGSKLLIRLQLTALPIGALAPVEGDTFQIDIVPAMTSFSDGVDTPFTVAPGGGVVTIGHVVPEPTALVLTAIGLLALSLRRRGRRDSRDPGSRSRTRAPSKNAS